MDDESFRVTYQDNVKCQFYCVGSNSEYGRFFWKAVFDNFIVEMAPHTVLLLSLKQSVKMWE